MKTTTTNKLLAVSAMLAAGLTGCGIGGPITPTPVPITANAGALGIVMGGQQPVGGVTLQIYETTSAGYGAAATKDGATFKTTAYGNFTLPSFTCTSGTQLFLVGTGGQPIAAVGATPAVTNNNLALMTSLGPCSTFSTSSFINMNELTTVATIYALAPFMTGPGSISTSSTNTAGLADAFAVITQLVDGTSGTIPGPNLPSGATLPVTVINTLGDILEQCINSGGGVAGDNSACGKLFTDATVGGVAPTDTITAMLNVAKNPMQNVSALNQLRSASPVFTPVLSVNNPPNAWTLAITYAPAGLSTPSAIATDASGNVWITSNGTTDNVTKLDYTGTQTFSVSTNYSNPSAIAIDASGNAWIANAGNNTLSNQPAAGGTPTVYSGNGLTAPKAVSIDGAGNVFVTNTASVSSFTSAGAVLNAPYTGVSAPIAAVATPK